MNKIHINTGALAQFRPAILVVAETENARHEAAPVEFVQIHCPCCNAKAASVEQHGNTAHVVVPRKEQIVPKETP